MPTASQLQGLSYDWAHLFGMPNIGAEYDDYEAGTYRLLDGEPCAMCPGLATNVHHLVPRSVRKTFFLGGTMLRSPLFALCGSGTTGCHDGFHGGARYKARWVWDDPATEGRWWSGELLGLYGPHSDGLFGLGEYVVTDRLADTEIHMRA